MYIGPWQEYKLAQVIRVKNDIYEGKGVKSSSTAYSHHETTSNSLQRSRESTPSTRSFSSETVQKPYPTFNIDAYCDQWRRVETLISKSENPPKKPPLPPNPTIRRRQAKSIQERRVNKMRNLYGINNTNETPQIAPESPKINLPAIPSPKIIKPTAVYKPSTPKSIEKQNFSEFIKSEVKMSENAINLSAKLEKKSDVVHKSSEDKRSFSKRFREEIKNGSQKIESLASSNSQNNDLQKFSSIITSNELEVIEESLNQENIDGLLQWVENLPDELSGSPLQSSKRMVL